MHYIFYIFKVLFLMIMGLMFTIVGLKTLGVVIVVVNLGWLGGYNKKKMATIWRWTWK